MQGHCTGETSLFIGARPWCAVLAAASKAQPAFAKRARECATALTVLQSARRAALVVIASCSTKDHCTGETPLSIGVRPWCAVPAAASNTQTALAWRAREHATVLAISREEAQYGCLRRLRAVPRWLLSLYARGKATPISERHLSLSAQGCGATC